MSIVGAVKSVRRIVDGLRPNGRSSGGQQSRRNPWPKCPACFHRNPPEDYCDACGNCEPCCDKCSKCGRCVLRCPGHPNGGGGAGGQDSGKFTFSVEKM